MSAAKRRRLDKEQVDEVLFDSTARVEYLTGFHKRKLQRVKHAQEIAAKKERAEKLEERRKLREARQRQLEQHVAEVNGQLLEATNSASDEEWNGISDTENNPTTEAQTVATETRFVDEDNDNLTTVTIEAVDGTRDGFRQAWFQEEERAADGQTTVRANKTGHSENSAKSIRKTEQTKRKKTKKFRYESKEERKITKLKQQRRAHGKIKR